MRLDQEKREADMKAEIELREKEWRASAELRASAAPTHYTSVYRPSPYGYSYADPYSAPRFYGSPMRYSSPSRAIVETSPVRYN